MTDRCEATYNTARCSHLAGHHGPHHSILNRYTWTGPTAHITTHRNDAA